MLSRDVRTARTWAEKRHEGQADKSGKPYVEHPARVAGRMETPEEQVVGWLHDTVEDTGLTLQEVEAQFGPATAAAVDAAGKPFLSWEAVSSFIPSFDAASALMPFSAFVLTIGVLIVLRRTKTGRETAAAYKGAVPAEAATEESVA